MGCDGRPSSPWLTGTAGSEADDRILFTPVSRRDTGRAMSEENVAIVRRIYANWAHGSSPAESNLLHPDIEWVNPSDAVEPGTRAGIEALRGLMQLVVGADPCDNSVLYRRQEPSVRRGLGTRLHDRFAPVSGSRVSVS